MCNLLHIPCVNVCNLQVRTHMWNFAFWNNQGEILLLLVESDEQRANAEQFFLFKSAHSGIINLVRAKVPADKFISLAHQKCKMGFLVCLFIISTRHWQSSSSIFCVIFYRELSFFMSIAQNHGTIYLTQTPKLQLLTLYWEFQMVLNGEKPKNL
jgi:hypothetical protein